jgi:RNA-splicing ligase RtcB
MGTPSFAEMNRTRMVDVVEDALGAHTRRRFDRVVDVHHNSAAWQNHFGWNGIVYEKGAMRARDGPHPWLHQHRVVRFG